MTQHQHPHALSSECSCIACAPYGSLCTCQDCSELGASWHRSYAEYKEHKAAAYEAQTSAPPSSKESGYVAMVIHLPPQYARALSELCVQRGTDAEGILLRALTHYQLLLLAARDGADVMITKNGEPWPIPEPKEHGEYLRWCRRRFLKRFLLGTLCVLQIAAQYAIPHALLHTYPAPMAVVSLTLALSSLVTLWSIP